MSTFKDRLSEEKKQLEERMGKLNTFLLSERANEIDPIQKSLLGIQFAAMATYNHCLETRISLLEAASPTV